MSEILSSINIHTEVVQRFECSYEIVIDVNKVKTRYSPRENTAYYEEAIQLTINKITKRNWFFGNRVETIYSTSLPKAPKSNVINFAYKHIEKIEGSLYS